MALCSYAGCRRHATWNVFPRVNDWCCDKCADEQDRAGGAVCDEHMPQEVRDLWMGWGGAVVLPLTLDSPTATGG